MESGAGHDFALAWRESGPARTHAVFFRGAVLGGTPMAGLDAKAADILVTRAGHGLALACRECDLARLEDAPVLDAE